MASLGYMRSGQSKRKIVVTTPTGQVGSRVVRLLVQAGVRPTALVRDPARLEVNTRERVDVVAGDQGDLDSVIRATRGADSLFWVDPPTADDDPAAGYARMGANAARAVAANGIPRTVFLSSIGAEKRHGVGEIDGLARTEEALNATGTDVLHLRCGYFFTNLLMDLPALRSGVVRTPWPLDYMMPWVDPRDIGDIAAIRLLSDWSGQQVQAVHGPRDLTFTQVVEILRGAVEREMRAEHMSDDEFRTALRSNGLTEGQVEGIVGMSVGQRENFVPENERTIVTTTPTTLEAWAYTRLRPLL